MRHKNRKYISEKCEVCGAPPLSECVQATYRDPRPSHQQEFDFYDKQQSDFETACLEYQIFSAVNRLRALQQDHVLVKTIEAVLKYQASEG